MKNKNVNIQVIIDLGLSCMGNLEISNEVSGIEPCTCSDYYLATKLSQKLNLPLYENGNDVPAGSKPLICTTWMYECELDDKAQSYLKNSSSSSVPFIGVMLTSKKLEKVREEYPYIEIMTVADPKEIFVVRDSCVEDLVRQIIDYIGEDPNRPGVVGTPERVVRMWKEIYGGYDPDNKPKITTFYEPDSINSHDIIFDRGEAWSNCEHHMAPFKIEYCFAYIPNPKGKLLGLSKISRVVRYCSQKMQLQERIGTDVVDMIVEELTSGIGKENPPLGVAIMLKGAHSCKTMRGVKTPGSMISTYTWGCFEKQCPERKEFMDTARESLAKGPVIFG